LLPSSSLRCLPPHLFFWSLHSMSLTSSPSSLFIMCPSPSLQYLPQLLISSFLFLSYSKTPTIHLKDSTIDTDTLYVLFLLFFSGIKEMAIPY
jgi:hypothetical protein